MGTGNVSYILYYISMFNSTCRDPTYTRMPIYYILYIPLISKSHLKHSVSDKDILFRAIPFWSFVINLNVGSVYIFWGVRSWHTCAMIFSATASWRGVASCNAHCIAFGKEKVCKFAHVSMWTRAFLDHYVVGYYFLYFCWLVMTLPLRINEVSTAECSIHFAMKIQCVGWKVAWKRLTSTCQWCLLVHRLAWIDMVWHCTSFSKKLRYLGKSTSQDKVFVVDEVCQTEAGISPKNVE